MNEIIEQTGNKVADERVCPKCGAVGKQNKYGFNSSGNQRYKCMECRREYTPEPMQRGYSKEQKEHALKLLTQGMTGRGVGKALGMSKANAYRWSREAAKKGK